MTDFRKSPNFDARADGAKPSMIILHYTGMRTAGEALARLCDPAAKVSAHYLVDEDGGVLQLVEEDRRAWHAGVSFWEGQRDINSLSVGIELVNPGHEFGYKDFPREQMESLKALCHDIMGRHDIAAAHVLGHSDIAPLRKQDPGELFPWEKLANEGIGIWPEIRQADIEASRDIVANMTIFQDLLVFFGYDPEAGFGPVLRAFHRHFYPEKYRPGQDPQAPDAEGAARLLALMRGKHESLKKTAK